jgi:hypothetical protein
MATPNIKHNAIVQRIRCMDNIDYCNSNKYKLLSLKVKD